MPSEIKLENTTEQILLAITQDANGSQMGKSDTNYIHNQTTSAEIWIINHNLNKYCSVTVVDDNNDVVIGEIHYDPIDRNLITLVFTAAFTGKAYLN